MYFVLGHTSFMACSKNCGQFFGLHHLMELVSCSNVSYMTSFFIVYITYRRRAPVMSHGDQRWQDGREPEMEGEENLEVHELTRRQLAGSVMSGKVRRIRNHRWCAAAGDGRW
jgi:hypothetical protein